MNDTLIRLEGMKALRQRLGLLDTEKFITLLRREPFDYTEWRRDLWKGKSIEDIFNAAAEFEKLEE